MKLAIKQLPVFYRYLYSYTLLFLLPLLLLGVIGYYQLVHIVGAEVERNNRALLDELQSQMDQKMILMNRIAGQLESAPELSPNVLTNNYYNMYQGKKLLESKVLDESIWEIALHIRGTNYLLSSLSIYKLNVFVNELYLYRNWTVDQFIIDINHLTTSQLRPAENVGITEIHGSSDQRIVTYIVPIQINSLHPYGTVLFLLKEKELLKRLPLPEGNAIIFDQQGRILAAQKQGDYLKDPNFFSKAVTGESAIHDITIQNITYAVSHKKSDKTGFTYVTLVPKASLVAPIHHAIWQWVSWLGAIFLAGCVLVYLLMLFNYNPVKKLSALVETIRGKSLHKVNEFETISSVIHDMADSNRSLGLKLEANLTAVREYMLTSILKGEWESVEAFNEQGQEIDVILPYPEMVVLMLEYPASIVLVRDRLRDVVASWFNREILGYHKESLEDTRSIFIISTNSSPEGWRKWMERLHEHVLDVFQAPITMGVGNRYGELSRVGHSYLEASTAIDYKLIQGNQRVIFFDELLAQDYGDIFNPRRVLAELDIILDYGRSDLIVDAVSRITQRMKRSGLTLFQARELCYDIIRKFNACLEKHRPGSDGSNFPDVLTLTEYITLDDISELLISASRHLRNILEAKKPEAETAMIDQIGQFIRINCVEYDFSVQKIANHFSLSLSYLSRYFKEQTGQTVMEYVHEIRIEQAKHLLLKDDCSLKNIVQQIGYYDVSSFIRKFKQTVGVTPGEYRKQHL